MLLMRAMHCLFSLIVIIITLRLLRRAAFRHFRCAIIFRHAEAAMPERCCRCRLPALLMPLYAISLR